MKSFLFTFFFISILSASAQPELYSAAYGNPDHPAIIFLHGGPGYNAFSFEASTAGKLSEAGFYVIVYDRTGCGRSEADSNTTYNFEHAFGGLNNIYKQYGLEKAALIGHSFGGTVGILFSNAYPEKVSSLILVGSPLSYQMTFKNIISRCKKIYTDNQSPQLEYIKMLEAMDTTALEYSSFCFMHAMLNGFYKPADLAAEAKARYDSLKNNPSARYLSYITREPVAGFYANEQYTTLDLLDELKMVKKGTSVFGIYGMEDGLFDEQQIRLIQSVTGEDRFSFVADASHSVFIDQQEKFIAAIRSYLAEE